MDIKVRAPGWVEWEYKGVRCEVKLLTFAEGQTFEDDLRELMEGKEKPSEVSNRWFVRNVRNIKGLTVNGKTLTRPEDVLDPSIGYSQELALFVVSAVNRFMEINRASEEEGKNSEAPPAEAGAAAEATSTPSVSG